MSYEVIARKYRPQTFDEVAGQRLVCSTLKNAIIHDRVAHGYIFSGARGVGKTTMARLLAKALNCLHGPTASPCGECDSCREIAAGNSVDVLEIDAASNRGIDEIRRLRENARYLPSRDRTKIFIIDEVHMLTPEAFNALLKTLEEPPGRVLFIMATTEAHKLPATIQSRCQHFAFRLLDFSEILTRLREICAKEGIEAPDGALAVIAQAAEGSMRDGLSLLDEAIAACGSPLDEEKIRRLLGIAPSRLLVDLAEATRAGQTGRALELVQEVGEAGYDLGEFCAAFTRLIRNLMIARSCGAESTLLQIQDDRRELIKKLASQFSEEDLTRFFQVLLHVQNDMRTSLQPRFHFELALVKLALAPKLASIESLLGPARQTTPSGAEGASAGLTRPAKIASSPEKPRQAAPAARPALTVAAPARESAAPSAAAAQSERHPAATPAASVPDDARLSAIKAVLFEQSKFLSSCLNPVAKWRFENGEVHFIYSGDGSWAADLLKSREHQAKLRAACEKVLGQPVKICVTLNSEERGPAAKGPDFRERVKQEPIVAAFQKRFDCIVMEIKDLSRE